MGEVRLVGQGPFALPAAQSATATDAGNAVVVSFRVLSDPNQSPQQMETVTIQVVLDQATELAGHLLDAVKKARAWNRSHNPQRS